MAFPAFPEKLQDWSRVKTRLTCKSGDWTEGMLVAEIRGMMGTKQEQCLWQGKCLKHMALSGMRFRCSWNECKQHNIMEKYGKCPQRVRQCPGVIRRYGINLFVQTLSWTWMWQSEITEFRPGSPCLAPFPLTCNMHFPKRLPPSKIFTDVTWPKIGTPKILEKKSWNSQKDQKAVEIPWFLSQPRRVRQGQGPVQIALDAGIVVGCINEDHVDFVVAKKVPIIQDAVKLQVDLGVIPRNPDRLPYD